MFPAGVVARQAFIEAVLSTEGQQLLLDFQFVPLPQQVLDMNVIAWNSLITAEDAMQFTFETSTDRYDGAADYVISTKRSTYADYERAVISGRVEDLQVCIACMCRGVSRLSFTAPAAPFAQ